MSEPESALNDAAMDRLVRLIEWCIFDGKLPANATAIVVAVLHCFPHLRRFDEPMLQQYSDLLHAALVRRVGAQRASQTLAMLN